MIGPNVVPLSARKTAARKEWLEKLRLEVNANNFAVRVLNAKGITVAELAKEFRSFEFKEKDGKVLVAKQVMVK